MSKVRAGLRYSAEHEWVDDESPMTIGISLVAADALGDVVFIELPEAGTAVTAGEVCGEIESTKSVSELFSPVTGEIIEVNDAAIDDPSIVNSDPYGAGWLFKVAVAEEGPLLTAEEYAAKNNEQIG